MNLYFLFAKEPCLPYNNQMEQKNLNFSQNQTLNDYVESMLELELKTPPPFNYQEETTAKAFTSLLSTLCGGAGSFGSNKREKLIYHVNAFHDKLTHEQWGRFHYDMCLAHSDKFDTFNLDLIDKYEASFEPQTWSKYILHHHGLNFEEIKASAYSGYHDRAKGVYYREGQSFKSLTLDEIERADELMKKRFLEIVVHNFANHHLKNQLMAISFFIKKTPLPSQLHYLESDEIVKLIKLMAPSVSFGVFNAANTYSGNQNYYENQTTKGLISQFYDEIFTSPIFSLAQKQDLLYNTLKIDKNHFYNDYNKVSAILREGSLDDNKEMFSSISFPLKTTYQTYPSEKEMILGITDTSRLQVGRGIKIAAWFLDICEKDFPKGKYLFEKFLPFIKEEMLLDKKTNEQENIHFLLAYANKKGKNSVTIKNKVLVVQTAIAQLEKEQLSQTLQMELFEEPAPVKKFKL